MDQGWEKSLTDALPKFIICKSEKEFHDSINEVIVRLNDSHTSYYPVYEGLVIHKYFLPVLFSFIDNKMVITRILNEDFAKKIDIKLGDVILSINEKLISDVIKENRSTVTASNEASYLRNLALKFRRFEQEKIIIKFIRDSKTITKTIELYDDINFFHDLNVQPSEKYKIIENNIGYVNMGVNLDKVFDALVSKLKTTKAIIFDLRNYPKSQVVNELTKFINSKPIAYAKSTNPDLRYPSRFYWSKPLLLEGSKDNYKGKIIVLINEETQSWSETIAMSFKTSINTTVIGSQTSGADGAVVNINLMKGVDTSITGAGFYYPNETQVQRIGIIPNIELHPTIAGIQQGRDEVLDRAIKFINIGK